PSQRDYEAWVNTQEWYQTIQLKNGIWTRGKVRTDKRIAELERLDFQGKSVVDIGCNSGQYSLLAKRMGASRVIGLDIDPLRIKQARILSANEELDIEFKEAGIEQLRELGQFDIVVCIAVLTEIENVLGGLRLLRDATSGQAIIEMGIAKPVMYLSSNRQWWHPDPGVSRLGRIGEMRRHKHAGWVMYPTLELIRDIFDSDFSVTCLGRGLRYSTLHVVRR
ncbi:MAG: methyltransferase domain-containing protein, partial [Gammaproteobacteria bacterium]|nr:methyltransferase domain-containing protein [Gammaproteobacteria bacterium]